MVETQISRGDELYANDAVWAAFYRDGKNLGDICKQFDCGIYDLSPWLTAPIIRGHNLSGDASVLLEIESERRRQVVDEGYSSDHDDAHAQGELAKASSSYAYEAGRTDEQREGDRGVPPMQWPWSEESWKTTDRRSDMVKAAALAVSEILRLDRVAETDKP